RCVLFQSRFVMHDHITFHRGSKAIGHTIIIHSEFYTVLTTEGNNEFLVLITYKRRFLCYHRRDGSVMLTLRLLLYACINTNHVIINLHGHLTLIDDQFVFIIYRPGYSG